MQPQSAVGPQAEEIVLHLLLQIIVILLATRIVTAVVRRLGQTDVSGEILAGLLLGPSGLGWLLASLGHADWVGQLLPASTATIFVGLAQIGLVLLMFQIGLEFEFKAHLESDTRRVFAISAVGILLPFALGYATAPYFHQYLPEPRPPALGFALFFAVAMSITAIPILGRIFMELRLSHTRKAALTISAAAIDDVTGWLLLGGISMLVVGKFSFVWIAPRLVALAAYLAIVFWVLRPRLKRAVAAHMERWGTMRPTLVPWMLLLLFVSGAITSYIGVFAIIGGFVIGVALHDDRRFVEEWKRQVGPLVNMFLLPIFFAYTGLRTDVGSFPGLFGIWLCFLICAIAFVSKFGGAWIAARAMGESSRGAAAIGVCMNTRALMELVVLNIGYDLGLLPKGIFSMLVIMALVSTFMATPLIRWLMKDERRSEPEAMPVPATARLAPFETA